MAFAFALPTGVYGSWGSVLDVNLKPFGISQVIKILFVITIWIILSVYASQN